MLFNTIMARRPLKGIKQEPLDGTPYNERPQSLDLEGSSWELQDIYIYIYEILILGEFVMNMIQPNGLLAFVSRVIVVIIANTHS